MLNKDEYAQFSICEEMIELLPAKIDKVNAQLHANKAK